MTTADRTCSVASRSWRARGPTCRARLSDNPDLAKTYRLLARYGPSYLYDGPLGQAIVQADDHPVVTPGSKVVALPGIMSLLALVNPQDSAFWRTSFAIVFASPQT